MASVWDGTSLVAIIQTNSLVALSVTALVLYKVGREASGRESAHSGVEYKTVWG